MEKWTLIWNITAKIHPMVCFYLTSKVTLSNSIFMEKQYSLIEWNSQVKSHKSNVYCFEKWFFFQIMSKFSPVLQPLLDECLANRSRWVQLEEEEQKETEVRKEKARNLWQIKTQGATFSNIKHKIYEVKLSREKANRVMYH